MTNLFTQLLLPYEGSAQVWMGIGVGHTPELASFLFRVKLVASTNLDIGPLRTAIAQLYRPVRHSYPTAVIHHVIHNPINSGMTIQQVRRVNLNQSMLCTIIEGDFCHCITFFRQYSPITHYSDGNARAICCQQITS